jgi:23S rRNA pseudouridine955/2504/2580 synthase
MMRRMSQVVICEVAAADTDIRLDRWFRRHYPALGHGRLEKLLRTGQVRVDGTRAKASTRLATGQKVRVPPLHQDDAAAAPRPREERPATAEEAAELQALVIHKDDDILVLNKPAGLAVQGGTKVDRHLDAMLDGLRFGAPERPRLVHRLDKETSGVLVLARTARAAATLAEAFRGKDVLKTYWALVAGVPRPRNGKIDLAIGKHGPTGGERVSPEAPDGKRAITLYAVVDAASSTAAWLALRPLTGRTHQLRVHCAALGTPILGDGKYGGAAAFLRGLPAAKTLHLHAYAITLPPIGPPGRARPLSFTAPLGDEARKTWDFLGFDPAQWRDPFPPE